MTVYVRSLTILEAGFQYFVTRNEILDLGYSDTITVTFTQQTTNTTDAGFIAQNAFVFSLVNCTISPTTRYNGQTFTVTPTTYGTPYSCQAVLTHETDEPGSSGRQDPTRTKTFTVRGDTVAQYPPTNHGLQTFDAASSVTLDTDYRCVRFAGFLSGNVTFGTPVTLNVTGLANDGTWGYNNVSPESWSVSTTLNSGSITVTATASGTHPYTIQLFRD